MKKLLAAVFSILLLSAALALSASAVGETLEANFGTPHIDGVIDEVWKTTQRQKLSYIIPGDDQKSKRASCSVYVSSLWDGDAIYLLLEIIDDDYVGGGEGTYDNDTMYFYVDEADLFDKTWQNGQNLLAMYPAEEANAKLLHGEVNPETQIAFGYFGDTGRLFEIKYVPAQVKLLRNLRILVDFKYVDVNEKGERTNTVVWSDELNEGDSDSSNWSYLILADGAGSGYDKAEEAATAIGQTLIKNYNYIDGTDGFGGEGSDNIWDGETGTKFCTSDFPQRSTAKLDGEYYITGIIMATANDNANYEGRCPDDWKIEASADNKNWVTLAEGDDDFFEDVNYTYFSQAIECDGNTYKYIRFANESSESVYCQLSEVMVCGIKSTASKSQIDAVLNPSVKSDIDSSQITGVSIVGAYDKIYSDSIADPAEPSENAGNLDAYSASIITVIVSAVFLIGLCAVIVILQSRRERK